MSTTAHALTIRDMIELAIKAARRLGQHPRACRPRLHAFPGRSRNAPHLHAAAEVGCARPSEARIDRGGLLPPLLDVLRNQIAQGVTALATFVDIDPQSEDRAIKAGLRAREHYADQLTVKFANQTLKGVISP